MKIRLSNDKPIMKCACGSENVVRYGVRQNQYTSKQRFRCNECKATFIENDGFMRRKFGGETIMTALHLCHIHSLRDASHQLAKSTGVRVNHVTVSNWCHDYTKKAIGAELRKMKETLKEAV